MTTTTKIGRAIRFATEAAQKRRHMSEFNRLDVFVCYLCGALENCGPEGEALSHAVFGIFDKAESPEGCYGDR